MLSFALRCVSLQLISTHTHTHTHTTHRIQNLSIEERKRLENLARQKFRDMLEKFIALGSVDVSFPIQKTKARLDYEQKQKEKKEKEAKDKVRAKNCVTSKC